MNDHSTALIAKFRQRTDGTLAAAPSELRDIGIKADPALAAADGLIDLNRLAGVKFRYDIIAQVIRFSASSKALIPRIYDASGRSASGDMPVQNGSGAVLNYLLYANADSGLSDYPWFGARSTSLSAALDARLFVPKGVLAQSGIVSTNGAIDGFLRLDSTWTYSDPQSMTSVRAGDFISGGLGWTRPVRLGGVQVERNFALRPDLITTPVPLLGGSAAVPSTVDVFVNNLRTYSRELPPGPFEIRNLPVISGAATQRLVIRDALGRETVTNLPFYSSSKLLQAGLLDYSLEGGFPRLSYGTLSNDYATSPVVSGSARYGWTDRLTLEGHAETARNLANAGVGMAMPLSSIGVASFALAGSGAENRYGGLYSAAIELSLPFGTLFARSQRTIDEYLDIASITATGWNPLGLPAMSNRPAKAIDQAAFTFPFRLDPSSLTLSITHLLDALDSRHEIFGVSYSRPLWRNASFYVTGFADLAGERDFGVFAGLTVALTGDISASASISTTRSGTDYGVDAVKSQPLEPDTYGWRLRARGGAQTDLSAVASYRTSFARLEATAQKTAGLSLGSAQMEGAIAYTDGNTFFVNRIDDAFAVIDAGAPNVDVFFENRPMGKTNARGVAFVPYLRSYQGNAISIDAKNLPVDVDVPQTSEVVKPADRSGVVVKFGIKQNINAALVSFSTPEGKPVAAGSRGQLSNGGETFIVGYDGQAYIKGLKATNNVTIERAEGELCSATFAYAPKPGSQVAINAGVCR